MFEIEDLRKEISKQFNDALDDAMMEKFDEGIPVRLHPIFSFPSPPLFEPWPMPEPEPLVWKSEMQTYTYDLPNGDYIDEIFRVASLRAMIDFEGLADQQAKALEEGTRPLHEIALMPGQSIIDTLFAQTPFDAFLGMDGNALVMGEGQSFWVKICERDWLEHQQAVSFLIELALAVEDVVKELGDGS